MGDDWMGLDVRVQDMEWVRQEFRMLSFFRHRRAGVGDTKWDTQGFGVLFSFRHGMHCEGFRDMKWDTKGSGCFLSFDIEAQEFRIWHRIWHGIRDGIQRSSGYFASFVI